jgi:hypothetical protein
MNGKDFTPRELVAYLTKDTVTRYWHTVEYGATTLNPTPAGEREKGAWVKYDDFALLSDRIAALESTLRAIVSHCNNGAGEDADEEAHEALMQIWELAGAEVGDLPPHIVSTEGQ